MLQQIIGNVNKNKLLTKKDLKYAEMYIFNVKGFVLWKSQTSLKEIKKI